MVAGLVALAAPHPRIPSAAAAAWALAAGAREVGTALAEGGVAELEEGGRMGGAAEVVVCVDWLVW